MDGRLDAAIELARRDALLAFLAPFVRQAAGEFPAALKELRALPLTEGLAGRPYRWTEEAHRVADSFDYVARAGELAPVPLLLVSGERATRTCVSMPLRWSPGWRTRSWSMCWSWRTRWRRNRGWSPRLSCRQRRRLMRC
ncbi:hypothetical protein [Amycolatopsis methanolica]|uniref:Uncharacterized protein n=1 Tax=Amycolatopsis methanolica 239 TaxID=1068978 RepID=A0A076MNH1_AMYME|nr:hypothetical protein AMETH_2311 [Amycolatopsis methanolica 239]